MDHKEFIEYSTCVMKLIRDAIAQKNDVQAHMLMFELMSKFIYHMSHDRAIFMTAPDYMVKLSKEISSLPFANVTIGP